LVLFPIGVVSLFYILFKRDFAKIHLEFSFLKLPIFVGEILLIVCLIALVIYWFKNPPNFHVGGVYISIFILWFFFKLITGYCHWGPLAFRHGALFYYSFFFMISFVFFKRDIFTKDTILLLFTLIVAVFVWGQYDLYWTATLACLGFILILAIKERKWVIFMTMALIMSIPYIFLVKIARMMFVANFASLVLIMVSIFFLLEIKLYIKLFIFALLICGVSFGYYKYFILGESGRTFASPREVIDTFKELDKDVQQKEKSYDNKGPCQVGLYHPVGTEHKFYYDVNPPKSKKDAKIEIGNKITAENGFLSIMIVLRPVKALKSLKIHIADLLR